jgi:hypothetical protein
MLTSPRRPKLQRFTSTDSLRSQVHIVDDLGLISSDLDTFKPHSGRHLTRNVNTVKIADFWGKEHSKKIIKNARLSNAASNLKFEYWIQERKGKILRNLPNLPHRIENLRCPVEKSRGFDRKIVKVHSDLKEFAAKDVANTRRLKAINEIIQSCVECENEKVVVKKIHQDFEMGKKRLTRNQRVNIENQIWNLDHKFSGY